MSMARHLQERALAAQTPRERAQLAEAFAEAVDNVLESIALEAKLAREARETAETSPEQGLTRNEPAEIPPAGPAKIVKH